MKRVIVVLFFCPLYCFSQNDSVQDPIKNLTFGLHYASIFAHSEAVQNTKGANPIGIEFLFTKQKRTEQNWQICNCYLNQGLGFNYFNFDNKVLGHAIQIFYNFEPQFKLGTRLNLLLVVSSGFSFLSNPYHINNNPTNQSYSLPVSVYVGLAPGLQYWINNKWQIAVLGQYLHVSNGGIKDPNKGINWPSANLRIVYSTNGNKLPSYTKKNVKTIKQKRLDVGVFGSSKTVEAGEKDRFLIYGLNAVFSKQISTINAITIGNELFMDNTTKEKLTRLQIAKSSVRNGILIGHEFLLGKFIFSQQIGYYLFNETNFFNKVYHRWGINYNTQNNFSLGINLLAHAQVANFLDVRITYDLLRKKSNFKTLPIK